MPAHEIQWELGRFKVWCGNLGALTTGRSSLDARLRDASIMRENILNNLAQLYQTLVKSYDILTGNRIPAEELASPEFSDGSSDSETEDDQGREVPPRELAILLATLKGIMNSLYKLSFHIRNVKTRNLDRSLLHKEVDVETGIDLFDAFLKSDKRYIEETLSQLRRDAAQASHVIPSTQLDVSKAGTFLVQRLAVTMNARRRMLRYWDRHSRKIRQGVETAIPSTHTQIVALQTRGNNGHDLSTPGRHQSAMDQRSEVQSLHGTFLSATDATVYSKDLDDHLDTQSNVSYISASVDILSGEVSLPVPPRFPADSAEFTCPYCAVVCPSRQGQGRSWKKHITQDLQPYFCTYEDCSQGTQMYGSSAAWLEHERQAHRRIWQCFQHEKARYTSSDALREHLRADHTDDVGDAAIEGLLDAAQLTTSDTRNCCPFCLVQGPFDNGLDMHMASHMLLFACFCIPLGSSHLDQDDDNNESQIDRNEQKRTVGSSLTGSPSFDSEPIRIHIDDVNATSPGFSNDDPYTDVPTDISAIENQLSGSPPADASEYAQDKSDRIVGRLSDNDFANIHTKSPQSRDHDTVYEETILPGKQTKPTVEQPQPASHEAEQIRPSLHEVTAKRTKSSKKNRLDPRFVIPKQPQRFFVPGRVIKTLWPEVAGGIGVAKTISVRFNGMNLTGRIRCFIVVSTGRNACTCLPISSYGGRGLAKPGVLKWQHCVVYTGEQPPPLMTGEEPVEDEQPIGTAIRVWPTYPDDELEPAARLNFGAKYIVEHNVQVYDFGMVRKEYVSVLTGQWTQVLDYMSSRAKDHTGFLGVSEPEKEQQGQPVVGPSVSYVDLGYANANYTPPVDEDRQISLHSGDHLAVIEWPYEEWARAFNRRTRQTGLVALQFITLFPAATALYDYTQIKPMVTLLCRRGTSLEPWRNTWRDEQQRLN